MICPSAILVGVNLKHTKRPIFIDLGSKMGNGILRVTNHVSLVSRDEQNAKDRFSCWAFRIYVNRWSRDFCLFLLLFLLLGHHRFLNGRRHLFGKVDFLGWKRRRRRPSNRQIVRSTADLANLLEILLNLFKKLLDKFKKRKLTAVGSVLVNKS